VGGSAGMLTAGWLTLQLSLLLSCCSLPGFRSAGWELQCACSQAGGSVGQGQLPPALQAAQLSTLSPALLPAPSLPCRQGRWRLGPAWAVWWPGWWWQLSSRWQQARGKGWICRRQTILRMILLLTVVQDVAHAQAPQVHLKLLSCSLSVVAGPCQQPAATATPSAEQGPNRCGRRWPAPRRPPLHWALRPQQHRGWRQWAQEGVSLMQTGSCVPCISGQGA
jgi:hypothetical protein